MKNYKDSDYAANRYSNGIVYKFATEIVEITLESYLSENPGKTAENFTELKALSDEIYLKQDRDDNAQTKRNISIHELEETTNCCVPSPEDILLLAADEKHTPSMEEIQKSFRACLTASQYRRATFFWMEKKTEGEIALIEGVTQQSVSESISYAKNKLKKYFRKHL